MLLELASSNVDASLSIFAGAAAATWPARAGSGAAAAGGGLRGAIPLPPWLMETFVEERQSGASLRAANFLAVGRGYVGRKISKAVQSTASS